MARRSLPTGSDLRGAARLAIDATAALTDIVEAMHAGIARVPGLQPRPADGRTSGITGLVYRSVRGVTRGVGVGLEALLGGLTPLLEHGEPGAPREAIVAALNGVLGDHLAASGNPLATPMGWRHEGRALALETPTLRAALPAAGPRLLLLIHGLCMNDLQWSRGGHDHGAALARELGYTPVYLRYNSGLHVHANGAELARQIDALVQHWPCPVQGLVLLGHSMGGLLARSALHCGAQAGQGWTARVTDLVCLGTPHHGAALERAGHGLDLLLDAAPYAAPLARLGRMRSAGITDLRHGSVLEEAAGGPRRQAGGGSRIRHLPLPAGLRCYAAAACTAPQSDGLKARLFGDGLVSVDSALGRHADAARTLAFAPHRQWVGHGINHLDLLGRAEVYDCLRRWLEDGAAPEAPRQAARR